MKQTHNTAVGYNALGPMLGSMCMFCFETHIPQTYGYCRACWVEFAQWLEDHGWRSDQAPVADLQDLYRLWLWSESERELESVRQRWRSRSKHHAVVAELGRRAGPRSL